MWHHVKDGLPRKGRAVLVKCKRTSMCGRNGIFTAMLTCVGGENYFVDTATRGITLKDVTHWRKMPDGPKGD